MKQYYLIPLTECDIYIKKQSVRDLLKQSYPELSKREEERISILYSVRPTLPFPEVKQLEYDAHNRETKRMYEERQIPMYLLAVKTLGQVKEVVTDTKLIAKDPAAFGIREVSKEEAERYYNETDYRNKILNYIKNSKVTRAPFLSQEKNVSFHIEGTIDGQFVSGEFEGMISPNEYQKVKR